MMLDAPRAVMAAKTVLPGSEEHAIACELCRLRGYPPEDSIHSVAGLPPVTNWQWLIAEQMLETALRTTIARNNQRGFVIGNPNG
jgi:hypothetical protein